MIFISTEKINRGKFANANYTTRHVALYIRRNFIKSPGFIKKKNCTMLPNLFESQQTIKTQSRLNHSTADNQNRKVRRTNILSPRAMCQITAKKKEKLTWSDKSYNIKEICIELHTTWRATRLRSDGANEKQSAQF